MNEWTFFIHIDAVQSAVVVAGDIRQPVNSVEVNSV